MMLPGRNGNAGDYRFGFQGQEMDNELKGTGNSVNYKYRMHDPRLGRFFAVDPITAMYPELTPYQFGSNSPIWMVEIEGLEGEPYTYTNVTGLDGQNLSIPYELNENPLFFESEFTQLKDNRTGEPTEYKAPVQVGSIRKFYGSDGKLYSPHWTLNHKDEVVFKGYRNNDGKYYESPSRSNELAPGQIGISSDDWSLNTNTGGTPDPSSNNFVSIRNLKLADFPMALYGDITWNVHIDLSQAYSMIGPSVQDNSLDYGGISGYIFLGNSYKKDPAKVISDSNIEVTYTGVTAGIIVEYEAGVFSVVGKNKYTGDMTFWMITGSHGLTISIVPGGANAFKAIDAPAEVEPSRPLDAGDSLRFGILQPNK